jgi:cytosine deaminase
MRERWAGRIDLQAASLIGCDTVDTIARDYAATADIVARYGGVLGMVTYPVSDIRQRLLEFFDLAGDRDLDVQPLSARPDRG